VNAPGASAAEAVKDAIGVVRYAAAMSSSRDGESFAALFEESSRKAGPVRQRRSARVGETVSALVVQVGKDAIFVELGDHMQAYIEAEELRAPDGAVSVTVGSTLRARVVEVDAERGIRLSPTTEAAVAAGASVGVGGPAEPDAVKIALGQKVTGAIHRVEQYGLFVQIEGTSGRAGRGLVPTVELGVPRGTDLRKAFPLGAKITTKVVDMAEGKIRLSVRALKDDEERAQFDGFRASEKTAAPPTLGTFGDLFRSSASGKTKK
jgi:small subunit ribosomal protein S1